MDEISDAQLLDMFTDTGDASHFNVLVMRHIKKVRTIVYGVVLNDADADDLTQEVFLKVMDNLSGFKRQSRFSTWLYRIAMNTTKDFLRSKTRCPVEYTDDVSEVAVDDSNSPAGLLMAQEFDSKIGKALDSLSPPLRAAIVLTVVQGMNVNEAAQAENCLVATMYWRVHHARKILENKLI